MTQFKVPAVRRLPGLAVRAVEQSAPLVLAGVSALYVAGTCGRASQKLFWHDELFTLYLARLPALQDVRTALLAGTDGTPPLFHAAIRVSSAIFGQGLIGLRAPSIIGFLTAVVCLYFFVSKRYGRVPALLASVLPIATDAYIYAYEARAYGIVLGCAGIALVSWQAAAAGQRRTLALLTLCASLSAAISVHYFAVLLLLPLGVGELARWWERRAADWTMWCAVLASFSPLILLSPLIRRASSVVAGRFSQVGPRLVAEHYEAVLAPLLIPTVAALVLVAAAQLWVVRAGAVDEADHGELTAPAYEWLMLITLVGLPLCGTFIGAFLSGAFVPRYALPWVLGFSALTAYSIAFLSRHAALTVTIVTAVFVGWVAAKEAASVRLLAYAPPTIELTNAAVLAQGDTTLPIAVTHGHTYLPLSEYAPRAIAARLVMLTQPARLDVRLGGASGETGLQGLATWMPLRVQDFDAFVRTNRRFLLYGPPGWMTSELREAGAHLQLIGEEGPGGPFAMSTPGILLLYEVAFD